MGSTRRFELRACGVGFRCSSIELRRDWCSGQDSNPRNHALRRRRPVHSSHRSLPAVSMRLPREWPDDIVGSAPPRSAFSHRLSRRLCGRLWCKTIPRCRPPAHPQMMLLEALSSAKVRHVCPPQTGVPYEKRLARSISVSFRSYWRCRPVSSRLVRILQIRAFPFRHCTEFGSPSQNRTEVGRFRAGRFATKLRGSNCFAFG